MKPKNTQTAAIYSHLRGKHKELERKSIDIDLGCAKTLIISHDERTG